MAGALLAVWSLWRRLSEREDGGWGTVGRGREFPRPKGTGGAGSECCAEERDPDWCRAVGLGCSLPDLCEF